MSESNQVSGRQIAAARALLGMGQSDLAQQAAISVPTLRRMEANDGPASGLTNNVRAVIAVLQNAGIEFLSENGVRLRKSLDAAE